MVLAGIMLTFAGLIAKETEVTQYEALKLQGHAYTHSTESTMGTTLNEQHNCTLRKVPARPFRIDCVRKVVTIAEK